MVDRKGLPVIYRKDPPYTLNVNFSDISRGTGYVYFYPAKCNNGSFIVVTNSDFKSELVQTTERSDTSPLSQTIDLQFNKPVDLDGDIFFNIPIGIEPDTTATTYYCTIDVYHYDGSTETQIGSQATSESYTEDSDDGNPGVSEVTVALKVSTGTKKHFAAGDIFRVKLNVYSNRNNLAFDVGFAHDPANRASFVQTAGSVPSVTFSAGNTQHVWMLPFVINN